ncbi:MAG: GSCFA domain-containing protein [Muribaculum sp.]|nr:GSCFA domain-containing protein [Muribaculum sp.]
MLFRTEIQPLSGHQGLIDYSKSVVMLGSCFSDNIGSRLTDALFDCCANPCGTLYNPASIASTLLDILYERPFTENDLVRHNGLWHSFSHHSKFSGESKEEVLHKINNALKQSVESIGRASTLIITFGTAWIYRLVEGNNVVANCHKMPSSMFRREMLSSTQIYGLWKKMLRELSARFPDLKIVFTISPIRHLADGAHANQLSKASLLEGVDRLIGEFSSQAIYFPAYEIMMDDLRDYRFYATDMVHPSETAIDYIYEKFCRSFMADTTIDNSKICESLTRRLNHRPLHGIAKNRTEIIEEFSNKYPDLAHIFKNIHVTDTDK